MGGMRFDEVRQCTCGVQSKELGPMVSMSIPSYSGYRDDYKGKGTQDQLMITYSHMFTVEFKYNYLSIIILIMLHIYVTTHL